MNEPPHIESEEEPAEGPLYPANRAFVIEIHRDATVADGGFSGRVEHLTSARVLRFSDLESLLRFLADANGGNGEDQGGPGPG